MAASGLRMSVVTQYGSEYGAAPIEIRSDAARIKKNKFLEVIYLDFYARMLRAMPPDRFSKILELGSGGGFLKEVAPRVITSECVAVPGIERVVDACRIGEIFGEGELDAICALNVFHHLPNAAAFLNGASHVLRRGGRIVLIEPWFTPVGQLFHRAIHHEPFVNDVNFWGIVGKGRMTAANTRLPTSVFRDSDARFGREFPALRIVTREPFHKWLYLLSGGLKLDTRVPRPLAQWLVDWDRRSSAGNGALGLFAEIVVERI